MTNLKRWFQQLRRNTREAAENYRAASDAIAEVSRVAIPVNTRGHIIDYRGYSYFMAIDFGTTYDGATMMMSFDSNGAVVEPMPKDIDENEPVEIEASPDITVDTELKDELE